MASTRFSSDKARIQKRLEESTYTGRYHLDTPGPGIMLPFLEDPHIRLQGWGANMMTHTLQLENELRGVGRRLERGDAQDYYTKLSSNPQSIA